MILRKWNSRVQMKWNDGDDDRDLQIIAIMLSAKERISRLKYVSHEYHDTLSLLHLIVY